MTSIDEQPGAPDERPDKRREYSGAASTLGLALLVIAIVGFGIWWFELRADDGSGIRTEGLGVVDLPAGANPTGEAPAAQVGRAAPNFLLATLDGGEDSLADYRGGYVLVNFWAAWCGPCRKETPELQAFQERQGDRVTVLGVNQQEAPATAAGFVEEFGMRYPVVLDQTGEVSLAYRVGRGLPVSMLVDPDGVIVEILVGGLGPDELDALAEEYLAAPAGAP